MSKDISLSLKGGAILLMLYYHLFSEVRLCELTNADLYIWGLPFNYVLARLTHPVEMFVILSGYGFYYAIKKGNYNVIKKVRNLYLHYWLSLLIFIPIGAIVVGTDFYPGSWDRVVSNVTGWYTNWNGTMWFLFPYSLLAITSPCVFKVMDRSNPFLYIITTFVVSLSGQFLVSRFGGSFLYECQIVHMPIIYFNLLFSFSMGAYLSKYHIIEKMKISGWACWAIIIIISVVRCCISTGAFHSLYSLFVIVLFAKAARHTYLDLFLQEMGKRSTSMWFSHAYFCYYYCKNFIYSFQYPILIFLVLLAISYTCSIVLDWLNGKVQNFAFKH